MADVEEKAVESSEEKKKGVTQKLEPGAEAPKPKAKRRETKKLNMEPEVEAAPEAVPESDPAEAAESAVVAAPAPHQGLTREEMNWAAVAHASVLVTILLGLGTGGLGCLLGIAIPAVIWYAYRDKSEYVVDQARQATVFQVAGLAALLALVIGGTLLLVVGWTVAGVLTIVLIGLLLIPVALILTVLLIVAVVALPVVQMVYGCYAAVEAYNGRPFRYRWTTDLIDRYQQQA
jgi:uncharacterized Tic20 family protein